MTINICFKPEFGKGPIQIQDVRLATLYMESSFDAAPELVYHIQQTYTEGQRDRRLAEVVRLAEILTIQFS